ncbi:MAG: hypothetical protein HeimC2_19310 [Candidatus Heimdallarchaeota archaeon LC_2]|nr:MAG: hypothetical protein HeimC2_19310 [Candidatus Heimdallarchaeota archaeon LC_2]
MYVIDSGKIEHNINLAKQYLAAMNTQNLAILDEIFHPSFQINQQIETPSFRYQRENADVNDIKNILTGYLTAFPDLYLKIIDVLASENSAVVYYIAKMTHMGNFFGLKATNKVIEAEGFYYFKMKEGKIIDYSLTFDTLKLYSEIGHAIIEEGDDGTVSEYLKILLNLNLDKRKEKTL